MFYDWMKCYQDYDYELPLIGESAYQNVVIDDTGEIREVGSLKQPTFRHQGSYSTSIAIRISGNRLTFDGNPSRYNRLDNVFGYATLQEAMTVVNGILVKLGLPIFTKCTKTWVRQSEDGTKAEKFSDGCIFQRLDITSNITTGGYSKDYIRGVSTQRYKYSVPNLYPNGLACDWRSIGGNVNLTYNKIYDKANEVRLHTAKKIKGEFGADSKEYQYILKLLDYLDMHGVVRFEQELKHRFLEKNDCHLWGLFDEALLRDMHHDFLHIDNRLGVNAMDLQSISQRLLKEGVVSSSRTANTTASYVFQWMSGCQFDFNKSAVQTHRARLRKIGIDIKNEYDASRFSPVYVNKVVHLNVESLKAPAWYKQVSRVSHMRLAS